MSDRSPARPGGGEWISIKEAAIRLDVTEKTIRQWIADGLVPAYRFGVKLIRIDAAELSQVAVPVIPPGWPRRRYR